MSLPALRAALITTDSAFRDLVHQALAGPDAAAGLVVEIGAPFAEFGDAHVSRLRQGAPDLVILDLENDPALGIQFAQYLAESSAAYRFIATGPVLEPELLMAGMRAGMADYLPKPVAAETFRAAVERAAGRLGKAPGKKARQPGQIFSVFSAKGGAGSTVFACNLAINLHRLTNRRTLLLDFDLELGEIAVVLGVQPKFSFVDFAENFRRMDAGLLASYTDRHLSGVDLLAAPLQPDKAEAVTPDQVRRILGFLRDHYDTVVVDTPRSFAPSTLAVLEESDLVFVVTTVDVSSLRNLQRALPLLKRVLPKGEEQIRLVVNRYNPGDAISLGDVERTVGLSVSATLSNDYEAVMNSVNVGKPVALEVKSAYARDIKAFGARVAGVPSDNGKHRSGLARVLTAPVRGIWRVMHRPSRRPVE